MSSSPGRAWEIPLAEWEWILKINLLGVVHGIRSFVPRLVEQGEGHVVNTASIAGLGPLPFASPYNATKHAVVGISSTLFHEFALSGSPVGVTVLCPGFVNTNLLDWSRNWPDHLGPARDVSEDPMSQFVMQIAQSMMDAGPPLSVLTDQVVDAIKTRRFLVTTDEELGARRGDVARRDRRRRPRVARDRSVVIAAQSFERRSL